MSGPNDWNRAVIDEFRKNGGKVGGRFANAPVVLITTRGARTGKLRTNPLVCLPDGERLVVFASFGGAPRNPDWFHNLKATPEVGVEFGGDSWTARATVAEGAERDRLYAEQARRFPMFGDYEKKTTRKIPVVILERES